MKHQYEYVNKRIILKPLEEEDIEALRILRNRNKHFFATPIEITKEGQQNWYHNYLKKNNDIMFKVVLVEKPEQFVGAVAVYDIDIVNKECEFGRIVINKELAKEKGIGTEVVEAICGFSFENLKMKKVRAEVLKSNGRAIAVYKKVGFINVNETGDMYVMEVCNDR